MIDKHFNRLTMKLKKTNDKHNINYIFDDIYYYLYHKYSNIDIDFGNPLLTNGISNAQDLINTYESDLGALDSIGYTDDSDTPLPDKVAERAGDIGTESPLSRENNLAIVENNFIYHNLNWWYQDLDNYKVRLMNKQEALNIVKSFSNDLSFI